MSKRYAKVNFVLISIIVLIGIILSVCSFKLPFFPNDYAGFAGAITMNYDMGEGQTATYKVSPISEEITTLTNKSMEETAQFVRQLLSENDNGYNAVAVQNGDELRVTISKNDLSSSILSALGSRTEIIVRGEETSEATDYDIPASRIKKAYASYQQISDSSASFGVVIEFDSLGTEMYKKLTEHVANSGETVYFYDTNGEKLGSMDSISRAVSSGVTFLPKSDIYTSESAQVYAIQVYMGSLDNELKIDENSVVSSTLGKDTTMYVCIALAIFVLVSFVIMIIRYRDFGLLASFTGLINIIIYLFLLQSVPLVTLSLATVIGSVVGFILTMFAHVMVFEKIRKQYATGKKIPLSVKMGFKDATLNVVDLSVVALIMSLVLYIAGFELFKGFAIALFIGSLLTMFSALVITRVFVKWYLALNSTKAKHLALTKEADSDEE